MNKIFLTLVFTATIMHYLFSQSIMDRRESNPILVLSNKATDNLKKIQFGMFNHFGPVTITGDENCLPQIERIPINEYDNLHGEFKPVLVDAKKLVTLIEADSLDYWKYRNKLIADQTRPTYHLLSPLAESHVADPNFAFFWKGKYHLFFIAKEFFEHVSSIDMIHWRWHPHTEFGGLSGTMFVNRQGIPTLITKNENIELRSAMDDDLVKWSTPIPVEPKVRPNQNGSIISHWDPDVWTEGNTTYALHGVYPLNVGQELTLMKSTDQKNWEFVGPFMSREMPNVTRNKEIARKNEDVSCPNFFKIGNKWMLLCISHIRGCRYYLGNWNKEKFTPDFHARMNWSLSEGMKEGDHGGDFFAPESLLSSDGRRVMWAWIFAMSNKRISETWHEVMSLPRELSLPKDGVLRIKPLRELEQLRYNEVSKKNLIVEAGLPYRIKTVSGDAIEILLTIKQGKAKSYGVRLLCNKDNNKGLDLVVLPNEKTIKLGSTTAPFELKSGEDIQLRIFVDHSIVEVFANDRQAIVKQYDYMPGDVGVCLFSEGAKMNVSEVKNWQIAAVNPW